MPYSATAALAVLLSVTGCTAAGATYSEWASAHGVTFHPSVRLEERGAAGVSLRTVGDVGEGELTRLCAAGADWSAACAIAALERRLMQPGLVAAAVTSAGEASGGHVSREPRRSAGSASSR